MTLGKKRRKNVGIIGLGKFGSYLAEELVKVNKLVICVDQNEIKVKKALSYVDQGFVSDDLSSKNLEDMGFKECDLIVVTISEHLDTAIFATLNALNLGVPVITVSNSEEQGVVLEKLGAEVIYPYKDSAYKLVKKILNDNFLDSLFVRGGVEIIEVKIPEKFVGLTVEGSKIRHDYGINIIALESGDKIETNFGRDYVFKQDDVVIVIGHNDQLKRFEKE